MALLPLRERGRELGVRREVVAEVAALDEGPIASTATGAGAMSMSATHAAMTSSGSATT